MKLSQLLLEEEIDSIIVDFIVFQSINANSA